MAATVPVPDIGAIIPTVKGRKIAYAIYAVIAVIIGNATVFTAAVFEVVPPVLIGLSAVITNIAPAFSAIAIANAKQSDNG